MKRRIMFPGIIVALVALVAVGIFSFGCQRKPAVPTEEAAETTAVETTAVETQSTDQLSEQPDKAKYDEYFTDFYLGKLPRGTQFGPYLGGKWFDPDNMPVKTAVFIASEDEFCLVGTVIKGIPSGSFYISIYDAVAKKELIPKTVGLPVALNAGDFGNAEDPISFPTGKYEYKIYIDDALVIIIPFEVR